MEYSNKKKNRMYERNRKNVSQIIEQILTYEIEITKKLEENESDSDREWDKNTIYLVIFFLFFFWNKIKFFNCFNNLT